MRGCVGGRAPHSFRRTGHSGMRGGVEEGVGAVPRPGLEEAWGPWRESTPELARDMGSTWGGHSSIRKLLTQRADDLSLIRNAQANNVFHAQQLMAPALGPGYFR